MLCYLCVPSTDIQELYSLDYTHVPVGRIMATAVEGILPCNILSPQVNDPEIVQQLVQIINSMTRHRPQERISANEAARLIRAVSARYDRLE